MCRLTNTTRKNQHTNFLVSVQLRFVVSATKNLEVGKHDRAHGAQAGFLDIARNDLQAMSIVKMLAGV